MKFENTEVWGFEHAMRGMRNPKNSWSKNDTFVYNMNDDSLSADQYGMGQSLNDDGTMRVYIGPNDLKLAQQLIKAGPEHRKFMRQIFVSVDITGGLFWWKEFDTYKLGTTANSTSTMHKLTSKPITTDCFEMDDYDGRFAILEGYEALTPHKFISYLEELRRLYLETGNKKYWKELVRWLPESWLQTRTITMNYETLPYAKELIAI